MSEKPQSQPAHQAVPQDVRRVDVAALAQAHQAVAGSTPIAELPRLFETAAPEAPPQATDSLNWQVQGECRRLTGETQLWLHLQANAHIALTCQRCLQPVVTDLAMARSVRFVDGESVAAEMDADSEDDILALAPDFDLLNLLEDEMLLALPLVPRHEVCPEPLPLAPAAPEAPRESPFAVLSQLKPHSSQPE